MPTPSTRRASAASRKNTLGPIRKNTGPAWPKSFHAPPRRPYPPGPIVDPEELAELRREHRAIARDLLLVKRDLAWQAVIDKAIHMCRVLCKAELAERDAKYRPDQPRVPAGNPDGGQWVDDGRGGTQIADAGYGSTLTDAEQRDAEIESAPKRYSPVRPGFHEYDEANVVCPAEYRCSPELIVDELARHAYPGQDPNIPVTNGSYNVVYDPDYGFPGGTVKTTISSDGLTVINRTLPGHIFHDGIIVRRAVRLSNGAWSTNTRGLGNNETVGMDYINQSQGPRIFRRVDERMRESIKERLGR